MSDQEQDLAWRLFAVKKQLEETEEALAEKESQIQDLKDANYWTARGYRKHLKKLLEDENGSK